MYKLLLCWRYLRTRYLALVCIVSVMLGVATLIVVNSVMAGFSTKLRERLHGLLSDVVIESYDHEGFADYEGKMARIEADPFLRPRIAAMTPTMEVFALIQFSYKGSPILRVVHMIGVDPEGRKNLGGFAEYLVREDNREHPSFALPEEVRKRLKKIRQENEERTRREEELRQTTLPGGRIDAVLPPDIWWQFHQEEVLCTARRFGLLGDPFGGPLAAACPHPQDPVQWTPPAEWRPAPPRLPPLRAETPAGLIIGYALSHYRDPDTKQEITILEHGDPVTLMTIKGQGGVENIEAVRGRFLVCDYFRSENSEYDAQYVFVPLAYLQEMRNMKGRATSIQIRLRDYRDATEVVKRLQAMFPRDEYRVNVQTWEQKQGPLLGAISIEKGILNVLLFMIIGVAGFGILAIFSMIVFEKTRDIGILKALGASNVGVMKIFLGYGLLLGVVGSLLGTALGLGITVYINEVERFLTALTGQELFNRDIYYFKEIPTDIQPTMVVLVNVGAVAIAVLFSVLPALRAALLHPVRALRYE